MKKFKLAICLAAVIGLPPLTWAAWKSVKLFAGNPQDGALVLTGKIPAQRSALDIWPFDGTPVWRGAKSELVLYRTSFKQWPTFERFSLSAMNDDEPMFRFSAERGANGQFRPVEFCFDGYGENADIGYCPLRITPYDGVQVCDVWGACVRIGG